MHIYSISFLYFIFHEYIKSHTKFHTQLKAGNCIYLQVTAFGIDFEFRTDTEIYS